MIQQLGSFQRPAIGETVCGDVYVVVPGPQTMIAVADGLGHGEKAQYAAQVICEYIQEHASDDLEDILRGASTAAKHTRGAAVALVRIDPDARNLSFAAVGNVELQSHSAQPFRPIGSPGIVARPLRRVNAYEHSIQQGDMFVVYTDGISSRFCFEDHTDGDAEEIAHHLVSTFGKDHDDATCIVIRC